jgi:hypothetical protein
MRHLYFLPLLLLISCGNVSDFEQISYEGTYKTMTLPTGVFERVILAADALIGNFPESTEGRPHLEIQMREDSKRPGEILLLITAKGYLDDSVAADQWRARLERADRGGWRFISAENRWQCYAGRGPIGWTVQPCS